MMEVVPFGVWKQLTFVMRDYHNHSFIWIVWILNASLYRWTCKVKLSLSVVSHGLMHGNQCPQPHPMRSEHNQNRKQNYNNKKNGASPEWVIRYWDEVNVPIVMLHFCHIRWSSVVLWVQRNRELWERPVWRTLSLLHSGRCGDTANKNTQ